jgi:hypothetical protein
MLQDFNRPQYSPKNEYTLNLLKNDNKKIIMLYRFIFGFQITIIFIYYIYNLCV